MLVYGVRRTGMVVETLGQYALSKKFSKDEIETMKLLFEALQLCSRSKMSQIVFGISQIQDDFALVYFL